MAEPTTPPATDVPPGWRLHTRRSPLTQPWEPLYARVLTDDDGRPQAVALALRVAEPHCNARGFAHGGLLSALADNAMGLSAVAVASAGRSAAAPEPAAPPRDATVPAPASAPVPPPAPAGAVTVSLVLDFIDSARIGDWLVFTPRVLRHGRTLAFTECHVEVDGRLVARASATFRFV